MCLECKKKCRKQAKTIISRWKFTKTLQRDTQSISINSKINPKGVKEGIHQSQNNDTSVSFFLHLKKKKRKLSLLDSSNRLVLQQYKPVKK